MTEKQKKKNIFNLFINLKTAIKTPDGFFKSYFLRYTIVVFFE